MRSSRCFSSGQQIEEDARAPFLSRIAGVGIFFAALTILGDAVVIIEAL